MILEQPLKHVFVTQPFGMNYVDFYHKLGLKGHNGIDYLTKTGCAVLAAHDGRVVQAGKDGSGGIGVQILGQHEDQYYKTVYYHLKGTTVMVNQTVSAGQLVGTADNTGKYTTGDHLHFGFKFYDDEGRVIDGNNGYRGCVDPTPYFRKNWDKSYAYHRYGRPRVWEAEYKVRFKNAWVQKQLILRGRNPLLTGEQVNAIIYGGWDFESIINPALAYNWKYLTKTEFLEGKKPFT